MHSTEYEAKPSNQWLPGLEFLRASAVFLVLIGHGKIFLSPASRAIFDTAFPMPAAWGVEFFFSLSGFLIGKQWLSLLHQNNQGDRTTPIHHFLVKRWLRTIPTYWLFFGVFTGLGLIQIGKPFNTWLIANLMLLPQLMQTDSAVAVSWTLTIEELSYLAFGLSIYAYNLRGQFCTWSNSLPLMLPITLIAIGTLARIKAINSGEWKLIWHGPMQRIDALAYGCILAWALRTYANPEARQMHQSINKNRLCLLAIALLLPLILLVQLWCESYLDRMVPLSYHSAVIFSIIFIPLLGISGTLATALCATIDPWKWIRSRYTRSAIKHLAKISYSVYLIHIPIRDWLNGKHMLSGGFELAAFVFLTILLATPAHTMFEMPFLALRKKLVAS